MKVSLYEKTHSYCSVTNFLYQHASGVTLSIFFVSGRIILDIYLLENVSTTRPVVLDSHFQVLSHFADIIVSFVPIAWLRVSRRWQLWQLTRRLATLTCHPERACNDPALGLRLRGELSKVNTKGFFFSYACDDFSVSRIFPLRSLFL